METNGKDLAFPVPGSYVAGGMTKREHFAALMLQGLLAAPDDGNYDYQFDDLNGFDGIRQHHARVAVQYTDSLIAALNE